MKTNINIRNNVRKLLAISCSMAVLGCLVPNNTLAQTKDAIMTQVAWDAYNSNKFMLAITNATACVNEFQGAARKKQREVEASGRVVTIDRPKDDIEKTNTMALGPLNAVATCWFIKGASYLKLSETDDSDKPDLATLKKARDAFRATLEYSHGRCWDTNGFFWSPAIAARDEKLPDIERVLSSAGKQK